MKYRIICVLLIAVITLGLLGGCSNTGNKIDEQREQAANVQQSDDVISSGIVDETKVDLSHTYTTRFGEMNQITAPVFTFGYPSGWKIESEEVTSISEEVVLSNDTGVTITYWNFNGMRELTGPTRDMNEVDIERVADASFLPGYVQATDYSDLGKFVVARIEVTGQYDMLGNGDFTAVDHGSIRYALLPESQVGEQQECIIPGLPTFSFWYAGHISMIARTSNENFTEQEINEVIAILSSFKDTSVSDSTENTPN